MIVQILCICLILCMGITSSMASSIFDQLSTPVPPPTEAPIYSNVDIFGLLTTATPVPSPTLRPTPSPTAQPAPLPEVTVQPSQEATISSSPSEIEEESREREEEIREEQDAIESELEKYKDIQDAAQTDSALTGMIGMMLATATPRPTQIPHPGETYLAPSYGIMAKLGADKVTQNANGSVSVVYCHVTEEDFQRFGVYLGELEYSVAEQKTEGYKLSLWLKKAPIEFDLVYEMDSQTLTLIYPSGTDYERPPATPTPTPTPVPTPTPTPAPTLDPTSCVYCEGTGICRDCFAGDCSHCNGGGSTPCTASNCMGGKCSQCSGLGYISYMGRGTYGMEYKERKCTYCNGTGDCKWCEGRGEIKCRYCDGSGKCPSCHGTLQCKYCQGTGKKK